MLVAYKSNKVQFLTKSVSFTVGSAPRKLFQSLVVRFLWSNPTPMSRTLLLLQGQGGAPLCFNKPLGALVRSSEPCKLVTSLC